MQSKSGTSRDLRPSAIDTDYATGLETVRVGVLDISDVPPDLVNRGEGGRHGGEEGEERGREEETKVEGEKCINNVNSLASNSSLELIACEEIRRNG